jgi:uncharacterized protein VirK/YbjX
MYSKSILELSKLTYPDSSVNKFSRLLRYRSKFVIRAIACYPYFRQLQREIEPSCLNLLLQQHLRFLEKPFRPYLSLGNGVARRTNLVVGHYRFMTQCLPAKTMSAIYGTEQGLEVTRFVVGEEEYSVMLCYYSPNNKEGDICMKLLDSAGDIFYSVTFSIFDDDIAGRTITVGGLQGPKNQSEIKLSIKEFTKKHHGQRPKDLMVKMLTIIANVWDVKQLLLVSNKGHTYGSKRYVNDKIKTNYDAHWESLGATQYNKHLYQLSTQDVRKLPEDIKRSKRAMYRKRYEWLDALTQELSGKLALSFADEPERIQHLHSSAKQLH